MGCRDISFLIASWSLNTTRASWHAGTTHKNSKHSRVVAYAALALARQGEGRTIELSCTGTPRQVTLVIHVSERTDSKGHGHKSGKLTGLLYYSKS